MKSKCKYVPKAISGINDCGVYKNLRVAYLFTDCKSIYDEAVSNVRENLQHLDVSIFTHILSGRRLSFDAFCDC